MWEYNIENEIIKRYTYIKQLREFIWKVGNKKNDFNIYLEYEQI